jgi:tRNA(Arg) A34 adenosine deaminase TadA
MPDDPRIDDADRDRLRDAIIVSARARANGNHPFGAVLVDPAGTVVLEAENTVVTDDDCTGHAETNLVRLAWKRFGAAGLAGYSLYTSCEPCAMCSGAIYWSGIGRVVYAMTEGQLAAITGSSPENPTMSLPSRVVLASGQREIPVLGPALTREASAIHESFWNQPSE